MNHQEVLEFSTSNRSLTRLGLYSHTHGNVTLILLDLTLPSWVSLCCESSVLRGNRPGAVLRMRLDYGNVWPSMGAESRTSSLPLAPGSLVPTSFTIYEYSTWCV